MTGYEAFKKYREESGLSVREFASKIGIAPRSVSYYENGHLLCTQIPIYKAIAIFELFGVSIEEFYDSYYPYKKELDAMVQNWKNENPRELNYEIIKARLYSRLAKIKQRKSILPEELEHIYELYDNVFNQQVIYIDQNGCMTDTSYEEYVLPIFYEIKKAMTEVPENHANQILLDSFFRKEYLYKDLVSFCDISKVRLLLLLNGEADFNKLHIITALKLCYVLDLKFDDVFSEYVVQ